MTGVGRYLLRRGQQAHDALGEILKYLVLLTQPCAGDGPPGWLVAHAPDGHDRPGEHLNLGLAHGISGPLALLSLAWRDGRRVDGQEDAIIRLVQWLLDRRLDRDGRPTWPGLVEPADLAAGAPPLVPARASWC